MFLKILMILSIAGSVVVIVFSKTQVEPKIIQLNETVAKTKGDLSKTEGKLTKTVDELESTTLERDTLSLQKKNLEQDIVDEQRRSKEAIRDKAAAEKKQKQAEAAAKRTEDMNKGFFDLNSELKLTPKMIREEHKELPFVKDELGTLKLEQRILMSKYTKLDGEVAVLKNPEAKVALPNGLRGKVLQVDPKWKFMVISIGSNHGVRPNGEMTVTRDGRYIARVKITKVNTDWSVANELEVLGDEDDSVEEGDEVISPNLMSYDPAARK
jgi:hypothetical protein